MRCDETYFCFQCGAETFQSLAGFLVRCDLGVERFMDMKGIQVSIPGGFSCALRLIFPSKPQQAVIDVSIPGGFSCALRPNMKGSQGGLISGVSIPGGFSCALRLRQCRCEESNLAIVSIPGGFSCALRLPGSENIMIHWSKFQSLAGFLVRCDSLKSSFQGFNIAVSIPGGFSCALRHALMHADQRAILIRFNPWRVFLCVATRW